MSEHYGESYNNLSTKRYLSKHLINRKQQNRITVNTMHDELDGWRPHQAALLDLIEHLCNSLTEYAILAACKLTHAYVGSRHTWVEGLVTQEPVTWLCWQELDIEVIIDHWQQSQKQADCSCYVNGNVVPVHISYVFLWMTGSANKPCWWLVQSDQILQL